MAAKTNNDSLWNSSYHSLFADEWGWEYGNTHKQFGDNYIFDPKDPPFQGCTDYHPPLPLEVHCNKRQIFGSSCIRPNINDADVYVSFDTFAKSFDWEHPWSNSDRKHIRMFINDGSVPENQTQFDNCINYVINALDEGKKVHAGCIAGHGRTGLFLAAVVQKTMGEKLAEEGISAIDYVRDNYCGKAVETFKQVLYLYGVYDVAPPIKQAKKLEEFEEIFIEEMGVDFRTVMKETVFSKINNIVIDIEKKLVARHLPPQITPKNTVPTAGLSKEELEDIFYNYDMKMNTQDLDKLAPTDSQLLLPYEPREEANSLLEENPFKNYPIDGEPITVSTPINEDNKPKFSFGKR